MLGFSQKTGYILSEPDAAYPPASTGANKCQNQIYTIYIIKLLIVKWDKVTGVWQCIGEYGRMAKQNKAMSYMHINGMSDQHNHQ